MRTIWKFPVELKDTFVVQVPAGATVLSVQMQQGRAMLWMLVNPEAPRSEAIFAVHGTGHPVPDDGRRFLGTFQVPEHHLVFHVFEVEPA